MRKLQFPHDMQKEVYSTMTFEDLLQKNGIRLSDEQMAAVYTDRSAIVSAGAGAGKTTVLSLRFVRLVMERKAHADQIMTLTFTRKAAAEMYERIYRLLEEAAAEDEYLHDELKTYFPNARISTLDSFWGEIARTDCMRFGITRDFLSLESDDADDMAKEVFLSIQDDENVAEALSEIAFYCSEQNLLAALTWIASSCSDVVTPFSAEQNMISALNYARIAETYAHKMISTAVNELEDANLACSDNPYFDKIRDDVRKYRESGSVSFSYDLKQMRKKAHKEVNDAVKALRSAIDSASSYIDIEPLISSYAKPLSVVLESFIRELQKEKRVKGMLSFHDTEVLSRMILVTNKDVRNYYKRCYRFIMVDEFQDNNSAQKDLLFLLAEKDGVESDGIPPLSAIDSNKLFFVGDDKQSIYYFRGADVSVFRSLKEDIGAIGGDVLSLRNNYRSEPALIDWFSSVFPSVFSAADHEPVAEERLIEEFTGFPFSSYWADDEPMAARDATPGIKPRIEAALLTPPKKGDETYKNNDYATPGESEAVYIADMIEKMMSGDDYLVPDKDGKTLRRPSFGDIAVLLQTTAGQRDFEKVFRMRNIPYVVPESSSITTEAIASDIYSFLQCLIYPDDKTAYMALLRSPFARISDKGLLLFADDESFEGAFSSVPDFQDAEDIQAFSSLSALYRKVSAMVGREPVSHILDVIYYESGYHTYLASRADLAVYEDHFSYLWEAAAAFDKKGKPLVLFLDHLRPLLGSSSKLENAAIQHFGSDAVSIMTIHKSKGLQFPVVFLADSARGPSNQSAKNKLAFAEGKNPLLMLDPDDAGAHPFSKLFNDARIRREEAERDRLLYVALTRASVHIIITGVKKQNSAKSLFYRIPESCLKAGEIPLASRLTRTEADSGSSAWYDKAVYSRGVYTEKRRGVRASLQTDSDNSGREGIVLSSIPSDRIIAAHQSFTEFGIMAHEAVEAAAEGRKPSYIAVRDVSASEYSELCRDADAIGQRFISSDVYKELVEGRETESEVRFYYPDDGRVIEGSADLLVYEGNHALVIDFKTDRVMCPEEHLGQITKYAQSLSVLKGIECRCTLIYLRDMRRSAIWDKYGNVLSE